MKVLIVEDEVAARENLIAILNKTDPAITIVGQTESVTQTVRWLSSNDSPDLIFMDIQLSDGSSFNIFSSVETGTISPEDNCKYARELPGEMEDMGC